MIQTVARGFVWLLSGGAALVFGYLGARRLVHPLELDPVEGLMMDHVVRLSTGQPIYVEPTLQFIPFAGMPLFATIGSLLARVFGPHFWELRLISLLSMLGLAALVFWIVRAETKNATLAAAGAGLLLMGFGVTGGFYDVGRPDSLMLLLGFSGLALLRLTGLWGTLGAAALLSLAFFTGLQAGWLVVAALVHLALNDRRRLIVFGPAVIAGCAGGYLLLSTRLGPWFSFFTWDVPIRGGQFGLERILEFIGAGMMGKMGALTIPVLLALGLPARPWRGPAAIWTWAGLGAFASGLLATFDPDTARHALGPMLAALSVLGPIALHNVIHHVAAWPGSERGGRSPVLYVLLSLQFLLLAYPVRSQLPPPHPGEARAGLLQRLSSHPGPALVPDHGFYGWSAGKGSSMHEIALERIVRARGNRLLAGDPQYFDRMFAALRSGPDRPMIVADVELGTGGGASRELWASIITGYRLEGELGSISESLQPVGGSRRAPRLIYLPVDDPNAAAPATDESVSVVPVDNAPPAVDAPAAAAAVVRGTERRR